MSTCQAVELAAPDAAGDNAGDSSRRTSRSRQQQRAQTAIDVIKDARLCSGRGMDAVVLKHCAVFGKTAEHERNQGYILLSSDLGKQSLKAARVNRAVIRGDSNAGNNDFGACLAAGLDDADQIITRLVQGVAAQAVVTAQCHDDYGRMVFPEGFFDPVESAERGIAADARVDDAIIEFVAQEALLQQGNPAFALRQPVAGGNAIAQDEYGGRGACR